MRVLLSKLRLADAAQPVDGDRASGEHVVELGQLPGPAREVRVARRQIDQPPGGRGRHGEMDLVSALNGNAERRYLAVGWIGASRAARGGKL